MTIPWPYHLDNRTKAIHLAIDPDCPYMTDYNCPDYRMILEVIDKLNTWEGYRSE